MFNSVKDTIKHSVIYGLGNISSKLVGFFLLPLYTEHLSTAEYGILAILEITSQIIVSLFSLNISTAMMRWCADANDEHEKKSVIFTSLSATVVISSVLLLVLVPNQLNFSLFFFDSAKYSNYFFLLFLSSSFGIYNLIPLTIMRLRERSSLFAFLNTTKFIITLLLNFYFIAYKNMGIEGILLSQLLGQIFLTLFSIPITIKNVVIRFRITILREMINYGIPLIFSTIFVMVFTMSDRFIIKYFSGDSSVGIYSLGHKIASVMNLLILKSFQLGFLPIAYKKLGALDEKRFFSKILTYYTIVLVFTALSISIFSKELIELLAQSKNYWVAYTVVPIIAFSFVLKGIQYTFSLSFHYSKKTSYNAVIVIFTSIINVTLNIIFIQEFGYIGAAYSMLLSIGFMLILSYYYGNKVYPIPYEIRKIFIAVIAGILCYYLATFFNNLSVVFSILLKLTLLVAFPVFLYKLNFFEEVEIERIVEAWKKWKNTLH